MKIVVKANPKCKYCLGAGWAIGMHALCGCPVCSCVTEQLQIVTVEPDYSIPEDDRYTPDKPEYINAHTT